MTGSASAVCIFCGHRIQPGEASVGRGETAAHAACADAAFADEGRWERIAGGLGDSGPAVEPAAPKGVSGAGSGRAGCALSAIGMLALVAAAVSFGVADSAGFDVPLNRHPYG